jgi:hypothetical protein
LASAQAHGDRDGLVVVQQQRRQGRAGAEPVAAADAAAGVHRVAEAAQPLHVVVDGPGRHPEPLGQLRAGPVGPRLEQRQHAQQPRRGPQHPAHDPGY